MDVGFQSAYKAPFITQVKCFEEFPKQEVPQKTGAQLTQQCITQRQEFLRGQNSPQMGWGKKPGPWEDTKAFLASFEQVAQACQWPREEWVAWLLPALSGDAQKAFNSLEARDREDYGKVKAAILRGEANNMETLRQHFRQFRSREMEDPRQIYSQLQELCHQWLKPERHSKEQILELLILEQFLAILPPELQSWIKAGGPENCTQAAALVEDFLLSHQETETCQAPPDLKEETVSLGEAEGTALETNPRTIFWEVMEESCGNADLFGGFLVPKPEPEQEETQYLWACEDGVTFPGSISGDRILSENGNENPLQGSPEQRELPEALLGYSQSDGLLRPEAYEAGPSFTPPQRNPQGKAHEELRGTNEGITNGIIASLKEKRHRCPECGHKTSFSSDLIRHMRIHTGDSSYPCIKCGKTFKHISGLNGHQRTHASKPNPSGSSQRMLQEKKGNKQGKKNLQKESSEPEEVNSMLAEVSQNMIPETAVIPEEENELKGHPEEESTRNQNDSIKLVEHNSSTDEDTRTVWVKRLSYLQGGKIRPHRSGVHESPHIVEKSCGPPVNGQPIRRRRCLIGSQQIHTGEKFCKCPECWEKLQSGWAKEDQKTHPGEKPLICSKCGKRFRWRSWLRKHQEAHT
ncbi:zinc finger protein 232-like [Heteronotia binoei]|uniref:zinc finger protein 232-like n=1 Tax=Heteronotia binoei TaxID=13085 RepID=UPI00292F3781|nr:zinc finger protein 232-like [Heteronotia binoei]